jgi:hypothetical protein
MQNSDLRVQSSQLERMPQNLQLGKMPQKLELGMLPPNLELRTLPPNLQNLDTERGQQEKGRQGNDEGEAWVERWRRRGRKERRKWRCGVAVVGGSEGGCRRRRGRVVLFKLCMPLLRSLPLSLSLSLWCATLEGGGWVGATGWGR